MKIAHISDTHLGHTGQGVQGQVDSPWVVGLKLRQREVDIMQALVRAIDLIIEHIQPDLVIHSGDLFDNTRPTAHTVNFAMTQFARLPQAGIQVVIIEGNHSYPRDRSHGHILQLLNHIPGLTVIFDNVAVLRYENIVIHAFPHWALTIGRMPSLDEIDHRFQNILVMHGVADGLDFFKMGRSVPDLPIQLCAHWYDYVALGHYHRFAQVPHTNRAFYAGSTAMITWRDFRPGHKFGINVITLTGGASTVERALIETRPMHAYGLDNAEGLRPNEVLEYLSRQAGATSPIGAYCQVIVEQLDPLTRRELPMREVEAIFSNAAGIQISLRAREQHWDAIHAGLLEGGDLPTRFAHLVAQTDGDEQFHDEVVTLGQSLLTDASTQVNAEDLGATSREEERVG